MTTTEKEQMFDIFKAELPKNAPRLIKNILIKKGLNYSLGYIRNVIYLINGPNNLEIFEAAVYLCEIEIDKKINLNKRLKIIKKQIAN